MTETATIVGHVVIFLTTVAGFVFQWLREGRRHRWDKEHYESLRTEIRNGHDRAARDAMDTT